MNKHITNQIKDLLLKLGYCPPIPRMDNYSYEGMSIKKMSKPVFTSQGVFTGFAQVSYGYPNGYVKLYIGDLTISSEYQLLELQAIYKKLMYELESLCLKVMNDNRHIDKEVKVNND